MAGKKDLQGDRYGEAQELMKRLLHPNHEKDMRNPLLRKEWIRQVGDWLRESIDPRYREHIVGAMLTAFPDRCEVVLEAFWRAPRGAMRCTVRHDVRDLVRDLGQTFSTTDLKNSTSCILGCIDKLNQYCRDTEDQVLRGWVPAERVPACFKQNIIWTPAR